METDNGKNDCHLVASPTPSPAVQSSPTVKYAHLFRTIQELQNEPRRIPEIATEANSHCILKVLQEDGPPPPEVKYTHLMKTIQTLSESASPNRLPSTYSVVPVPVKAPKLIFSSVSKLSKQVFIDRENSSSTACDPMESSDTRNPKQTVPSLKFSETPQSIEMPAGLDQTPIINIVPLHQLQESSLVENPDEEESSLDENARQSGSGSSSGYGTDMELDTGRVHKERKLLPPSMNLQLVPPTLPFRRKRKSQVKRNRLKNSKRRARRKHPPVSSLMTTPVMNQIPLPGPEPWSSTASLYISFESPPSQEGVAVMEQSVFGCEFPQFSPTGFISHPVAAAPALHFLRPKKVVRYSQQVLDTTHLFPVPSEHEAARPVPGGEPLVEREALVLEPTIFKPRRVTRYFHAVALDNPRDCSPSRPSRNKPPSPSAEDLFVKQNCALSAPKIPRPKKAFRYFNQPVLESEDAISSPSESESPGISSGEQMVKQKEVVSVPGIPNQKKVIQHFGQSATDDVMLFALRSRENSCKRKRVSPTKKAKFGTYRTTVEAESESESDSSDSEFGSPVRQKPKMEYCDLKPCPEVWTNPPVKCFESPQVPEKLYYYTTEEEIFYIFQQKYIGLNEMSTARTGSGIYFSEIPPENESFAIYYNSNYNDEGASNITDFSRTEFCLEFSSKLLPALRFCVNQRWHFSDVHGWRLSGIWKSAVDKLQLIFTQGIYYRRELNGPGIPKHIQSFVWDLG